MAEITREEFSKIYKEKFEPILGPLETERINVNKKTATLMVTMFISVLWAIFGTQLHLLPDAVNLVLFIILGIVLGCVSGSISSKFRKKLKKDVISRVLSLYGNIYFAGQKDLIKLSDIKNMGLFRRAESKQDDDIVIGVHKNLNFIIVETHLTHEEGNDKNKNTVTDFKGIILKVQMNKNFLGKTVVGVKGHVNKPDRTFDKVELESVEFMKNREIYSTDQIEARYILTTSFMERIAALGKAFLSDRTGGAIEKLPNINVPILGNLNAFLNPTISAAFVEGYAYLFVPTCEDFFEIPINSTLFNEYAYFKICRELDSIMGIIEHLHLDKNTGL